MDDKCVSIESSQNGLRSSASFIERRVFGNVLTIDPLDEEVKRQSNHHQN